jgi:hypothetical protein
MKRLRWPGLILFCFLIAPVADLPAEQNISVGYGFGVANARLREGSLEDGRYYDFWQIAYSYEKALWKDEKRWWKDIAFYVEPFAAYVTSPTDGFEGGASVGAKWYFVNRGQTRVYFGMGAGGAYSTIDFEMQSSRLVFMLTGALGLTYKSFFIEDRFRHYSNGGTGSPNRSINANIVSIGMSF